MLATEAHNDKLSEVWDTCSAGHEFSGKIANFAIDFELDWLVFHEIFLLKREDEV